MSKFCKNCGAELNDDAAFCGSCGTQAESCDSCCAACQTTTAPAPDNTNGLAGKINQFIDKLKKKDKKALGILAGIAAALILILVLVLCLSGGGPEKALDTYLDVIYRGKISKVEKIAPEKYWESLDEDMDDVEDNMKTVYKLAIRALEDEYGDNIKISYKITDKDEVTKSALNEMKDNIKSKYDIPKKNVTDACELEVDLTIKGDEDKETKEVSFFAVKVDGDWYICDARGNFLNK